MSPRTFSERVTAALKAVPRGRVVTYGQLAALAGNPRGARLVVWTLNALSEREQLPWHRVINAQGKIALTGEGQRLQRRLLEEEGIEFSAAGKIDLARFQWHPA